jgi:hypothetical protein
MSTKPPKKKHMDVECDKSQFPLAILRLDGPARRDVDFQKFTNEWSAIYIDSVERKQKFRLVIDARKLGKVDIKYLYGMAKFLMHAKKLTENWMDRTAIWVSSKRVKNLLHFVFKFYKPVRPFKIFGPDDEAGVFKWVLSNENGEEVKQVKTLSEHDIRDYVTDDNHMMESEEVNELKLESAQDQTDAIKHSHKNHHYHHHKK